MCDHITGDSLQVKTEPHPLTNKALTEKRWVSWYKCEIADTKPKNLDNWEVLCFSGAFKEWRPESPYQARLHRFALQSVSRLFLPKSRTSKCLRVRTGDVVNVQVTHSKEKEKASYSGLQTCGSVWACPVCAQKVANKRRLEMQRLIERHLATGGDALMITRTFPHTRFDSLKDSIASFQNAETRFRSGKGYKLPFQEVGFVGSVKALEVTYGKNGWHPHVHEIILTEKKVSPAEHGLLVSKLWPRWQRFCVKVGLPSPSAEHGLTIQKADKAAAYVSKWGIEDEMTKGHIKQGKGESCTPFDFLRVGLLSESQDVLKASGALFREYANAFHGKVQLRFSKGLKALYDIEEMSDEELAEQVEDDSRYLGDITPNQWKLILQVGKRGHLLERLSGGDWSQFAKVLAECKNRIGNTGGKDTGMHGACTARPVAGPPASVPA